MTCQNFFLARLQKLEQTTSVDEFYVHFDALRDLIEYTETNIPESYYTSLFITGLATEVHAYVEGFFPVTVLDAYCLACIFVNGYSRCVRPHPAKVVVAVDHEVTRPTINTLDRGTNDVMKTKQNDVMFDNVVAPLLVPNDQNAYLSLRKESEMNAPGDGLNLGIVQGILQDFFHPLLDTGDSTCVLNISVSYHSIVPQECICFDPGIGHVAALLAPECLAIVKLGTYVLQQVRVTENSMGVFSSFASNFGSLLQCYSCPQIDVVLRLLLHSERGSCQQLTGSPQCLLCHPWELQLREASVVLLWLSVWDIGGHKLVKVCIFLIVLWHIPTRHSFHLEYSCTWLSGSIEKSCLLNIGANLSLILVLSFMGCNATSFRGYIQCKDGKGFNSDILPCFNLDKGGIPVGSIVSSEAKFSAAYKLGIPCDLISCFVLSSVNTAESQWCVHFGVVFGVFDLLPILQKLWLIAWGYSEFAAMCSCSLLILIPLRLIILEGRIRAVHNWASIVVGTRFRAVSYTTQGFYICISLWAFEAVTRGPLTIHWVLLYPPFGYNAFYDLSHMLYCTY